MNTGINTRHAQKSQDPAVDIPGVLDVPPKITKEGSEGVATGHGFWAFFLRSKIDGFWMKLWWVNMGHILMVNMAIAHGQRE